MKALVLHGPNDLRLEDALKPTAGPGGVVVKVKAAPLWDYLTEVVRGERPYPLTFPLIFGTCCVGTVDEVGPDVTTLEPGQLVFCDYVVRLRDSPSSRIVLGYHGGRTPAELKLSSGHWKNGCFAEFVQFPAENAHPMREQPLADRGISTNQLAEMASLMPAMGAANAINIQPGETVLVIPATGFFSSSVVAVVLSLGADVIVGGRSKATLDAMVESFGNDARRITPVELSGDIGQDHAALLAATPGGQGADAYVDFSPPVAANTTHIVSGLLTLKVYGRCCFAGVIMDNVSLPYALIFGNCLTIRGMFGQERKDVVQTIRLLESGALKPMKKINGQFALEDHQTAMRLACESRGWDKMVILTP